jgi:hypothetical protein
MTIKLRASGWELGGEFLPWIWGQINYWDIERSHWRDVLRSYRQAGHAVVATAAVPRVHQTSPGHYDFGKLRPQNDLAAFLTEAQEAGLKVVLWAGPRDLPGVAAAGYPEEVLLDEDALARDAEGNFVLSSLCSGGEAFALPSLVTDKFQQALEPFARELTQIVSPMIHPDGPVIGLGLTQAPAWQSGLPVWAADYHLESLTLYHAFIRKRYSRISSLNIAYAKEYKTFNEVEPPRQAPGTDAFPSAWHLDWAYFREDYFVQAAERLVNLFSPATLKRIPLFMETIPTSGRPNNMAELDRMRCFAYTTAEQPLQAGNNLGQALSLAYSGRFLSWFKAPLTKDDSSQHIFELTKSIAWGWRGWEALSPSGAGRHPGFITDRQGAIVRPHHPFWETLLETARSEGLLHSQLHAEVALLSLPDFERARYLAASAPSRLDLLGQSVPESVAALDADTQAYVELSGRLEDFFLKNQYPFVKAEGDSSPDRLERYPLVVVAGNEHMSKSVQALLADLLETGTPVLIVGSLPVHPEEASHAPLAEYMEVKTKKTKAAGKGAGKSAKVPKKGRLYHSPDFVDIKLMRLLQLIGVQRPVILDNTSVQLTFHKFRNRLFIAAINSGEETIETVARRDGKFVLKDFWNNNKFWGGNNEIKISLPARSVKFWELIEC